MKLIFIFLFSVCSQFFFDVSHSQDNQNHCSELYGCQDIKTQDVVANQKQIQIRNSDIYKRDSGYCDSYAQSLKKGNPKINSYEERCKEYLNLLGIGEKNSHADIDFVDKNEWDSPKEILEVCKSSKKFKNLDVSFEIISECEYSIKRVAGIKSYQISRKDLEGIYNLPDQYRNLKSEIEQENLKIKQAKIKEQKKISELKSLREDRGKWGINFSMTKSEVEKCIKKLACSNDINIYYIKYEGLNFVNSFHKDFGKFTLKKYTKLLAKLNIRYKSVLNIIDFDTNILPRDYYLYNNTRSKFHVFENKKKPDEPKYITLQVTKKKLGEIMMVSYETENWGKNLLFQLNQKKSREQKYMDDL